MNTNQRFAKMGLDLLKESVYDVLYHAQNEKPLLPEEIRKRLNIPKVKESHDRSNTLIFGILYQLRSEGRAEDVREDGNRAYTPYRWKIVELNE